MQWPQPAAREIPAKHMEKIFTMRVVTLGQAAKRTCEISIFVYIQNSRGQGLE